MTTTPALKPGERGRVRYQTEQLLTEAKREIRSQLTHYEDCFSKKEYAQLTDMATSLEHLAYHIETND